MPIRILDHPLAGHTLAFLRDVTTPPERFRSLCKTLTTMLVLEATMPIPTREGEVQTPLESARASLLGQGLAVVPVLRAGLGMLEPIVEMFPDVAIGYIGLERHEETAVAHSYYCKLPRLEDRFSLCVDPMLATGGSASQAISLMKANGASAITMVCVVAAPEGVERLQRDHPEVTIVTAAVDRGLNDRKYILPGLGDFGDRLYGTQ
jgi:uracil phosphoribosyltransferase